MQNPKVNRRHILKMGAVGIAGCFLPKIASAYAGSKMPADRHLSFFNTHTRERLSIRYCRNGVYCKDALNQINRILRDHRTGDIHPMAPELIDLVFSLKTRFETNRPFHIISGYRSPATNAMLRKNSFGVAKKSFHLQGKAIDLRLPGTSLSRLKKMALSIRGGGVGFYPRSDFVHLDVGPVRYWQGS